MLNVLDCSFVTLLLVAGLITCESLSGSRRSRSVSNGEVQISLHFGTDLRSCGISGNPGQVELHYRTWTFNSSAEQEEEWLILGTLTRWRNAYNLPCSSALQGIQFLLRRVDTGELNECCWRVRDFVIEAGENCDSESVTINNFFSNALNDHHTCYVAGLQDRLLSSSAFCSMQNGVSGLITRAINYNPMCPGNISSLLTG